MIAKIIDASTINLEPENALEHALIERLAGVTVKVLPPKPLEPNVAKLEIKVGGCAE